MRAVFLLLILLVLIGESYGFPKWYTNRITRKLSGGDFVIQADRMRLDMLTGLYFSEVRIFRKKLIGPPAIAADGMLVRLNVASLFSKASAPLFSLRFSDGIIMPAQSFAVDGGGGGAGKMNIEILLERMRIEDVPVEQLAAEVRFDAGSTSVTNIAGSVNGIYGKGNITGWVKLDTLNDLTEGHVITDIDPGYLVTGLNSMGWAYTVKLIRRFNWGESKPAVETRFSKQGAGKEEVFISQSIFSMREYSYKGVWNDSCEGALSIRYDATSEVVSVDSIKISIGEGAITGNFAYDSVRERVSFRTVTDVEPRDFFLMTGAFDVEEMEGWRFPGRTVIVSEGVIDVDSGEDTLLVARVESAGMGYDRFIADPCSFDVLMSGAVCRLENIRGSMWSGSFEGHAQLSFDSNTQGSVSFNMQTRDCSFAEIAKAFAADTENHLSGKYSMNMQGGFMLTTNAFYTLNAFGSVKVEDGHIFQMPLFGGLTKIMTRIVPGLDFVLSQGDLNARFKIEDSKISSEKIAVDGNVLSLKAKGSASLEGEMDYAVQITLMSGNTAVSKVLRAITWPISKLLEFRLKGSVSDPEWYPINFSSELLERIGLMRSEQDESSESTKLHSKER